MKSLSRCDSRLLRTGGALLSSRGRTASLLVLIYHRVLAQADPLLPGEPERLAFASQMDLIAEHFRVLPLREAVARLARGALPARALCITFDDGYANNAEVALPILRSRNLPATVFVAPGFLNGGCMFNDVVIEAVRRAPPVLDLRAQGLARFELANDAARIIAIDRVIAGLKYLEPAERDRLVSAIAARAGVTPAGDLMMTDSQVRALHEAGIEIGAHTMTHPILTRIDPYSARCEMRQSKERLEQITGAPVRCFAYPNGRPSRDYDASHVALARELGFELALSTAWGAASATSDPFQIPRIAPWDRTARRYAVRLAFGYRQRRFDTA